MHMPTYIHNLNENEMNISATGAKILTNRKTA